MAVGAGAGDGTVEVTRLEAVATTLMAVPVFNLMVGRRGMNEER